jgi:hypothetical protein
LSPAPPSPRFARFASSRGPPPPLRGGGWRAPSRSRDACAPEVCRPKPRIISPQNNEGRRSAEKTRLSRGASPRSGCRHPSALRAGPRVQRNALAFRRSTAALASASCRSSIQAALHAMQREGVTSTLASRSSEAPRAPVIMPAGSMPGSPESGGDEPPPAGTAPTPSVGVTG